MKGKKLLIVSGVLCLALIMVLLPLISACAPAEEKTLKIGMTTPSSGPAAEKGTPMGHANLDAIKYINEELGGVGGYQIEVLWLDNAYDASKAATIIKRFMDEDCLLFTTASSGMMSAIMELANRDEFPGFACFSSPALTHPPQHIYGQTPDYGDDWAAFATYYMENIWQGDGRPKMALHLLNNPTGYGARDATRALADELGIDIIATEEHTTTTTSEIESLTRIKALEPDVLYISSTPAPTAIIIKNAVALDMYPGITIGCGHASFTKALIDLGGADIVEGVYGVYPTVSWGDDVPAMAKVTEYVRKYHPEDEGNMDYIISWAQSLIAAEILRLAAENAGIDNLTPQVVEEQGFKKLKNFDVGGLHGPVSYSPGDNRLSKSVRVFQIEDGEITPISGWVEAPLIKYEDFDWFGQ
jgi:branched-chain amino acid transport system substrate-binding protein